MDKQIQKFNVVCVTKRPSQEEESRNPYPRISWHEPITGELQVVTEFEEVHGVRFTLGTRVLFQHVTHHLAHVRAGLDGTAVVIGVVMYEESPFKIWELYTDTPVDGSTTPEKIREKAARQISYRSRASSQTR